MAKKKTAAQKAAAAAAAAAAASTPSLPKSTFPFARCATLLPPHTLLLLFTLLYLPRSSQLFFPLPPQKSSLDHPQPAWLAPITASPAWTMVWVVMGTWACVGAWAGSLRSWYVKERGGEGRDAFRALRNAVQLLGIATPAYFLIIVLFGAPLTSYINRTLLLAVLLSLLTVYIPAYVLPPPSLDTTPESVTNRLVWTRIFSAIEPRSEVERALVYPALGAVIGCWLGAAPIALDWDRPWQAWPLTPAYGAVLGYIVGAWAAFSTSGIAFFAQAGRNAAAQDSASKKTS